MGFKTPVCRSELVDSECKNGSLSKLLAKFPMKTLKTMYSKIKMEYFSNAIDYYKLYEYFSNSIQSD